jgi:hypothetical protein
LALWPGTSLEWTSENMNPVDIGKTLNGGSAYHKAVAQDNRQKFLDIDPCLPLGFELAIPVFMLSKTKHLIHHVATEWLYLFITFLFHILCDSCGSRHICVSFKYQETAVEILQY